MISQILRDDLEKGNIDYISSSHSPFEEFGDIRVRTDGIRYELVFVYTLGYQNYCPLGYQAVYFSNWIDLEYTLWRYYREIDRTPPKAFYGKKDS